MLLPPTEDVKEISFPTLITVSDGDGGHWLRKPSFHYISHIQDERGDDNGFVCEEHICGGEDTKCVTQESSKIPRFPIMILSHQQL